MYHSLKDIVTVVAPALHHGSCTSRIQLRILLQRIRMQQIVGYYEINVKFGWPVLCFSGTPPSVTKTDSVCDIGYKKVI